MSRTIWTYSRVRVRGRLKGTPCQPSPTIGLLTPSPRRKRPLVKWSRVSAVIALVAGVRAGICATPVPMPIRVVRAATHAATEMASDPYDSADHTHASPSRSASSASGAGSARVAPLGPRWSSSLTAGIEPANRSCVPLPFSLLRVQERADAVTVRFVDDNLRLQLRLEVERRGEAVAKRLPQEHLRRPGDGRR